MAYKVVFTNKDPRLEGCEVTEDFKPFIFMAKAIEKARDVPWGQFASVYCDDGECVFELDKTGD